MTPSLPDRISKYSDAGKQKFEQIWENRLASSQLLQKLTLYSRKYSFFKKNTPRQWSSGTNKQGKNFPTILHLVNKLLRIKQKGKGPSLRTNFEINNKIVKHRKIKISVSFRDPTFRLLYLFPDHKERTGTASTATKILKVFLMETTG